MGFLANLKIGARLAIGLGALVAIVLMMAVIGMRAIQSQYSTSTRAMAGDVALDRGASELRYLALTARSFEKDIFMYVDSPEKVASYHKKWSDVRGRIARSLQQMSGLTTSAEDEALLKQLGESFTQYEEGVGEVFGLIATDQIKTTRAANTELEKHEGAIRQFEELTQKLSDFASERVKQVGAALKESRHLAFVMLGYAAVLAAVLSLALATLLTRSITRPLGEAVDVVKRLAQGDLTSRIEVRTRDELGQLSQA